MAPRNDPTTSSSPAGFAADFDYLIVGGGTAGLAIAVRLSANPNIIVGLLEAGPKSFADPLITVPGRFGESIGGQYDWNFETTPQPALNGRSLKWPRGKVIGGTSALNFMTWTRGNREDYDAWEELGNDGWGWDGLLPYFKKTETLHEPTPEHQTEHQLHSVPDYHGTGGPVTSVYSKEFSTPHQHWHTTLESLGLKTNRSHFSGSNLGAFTTLTSVDPRTRSRASSATAYYSPVASRKNLYVLCDATAEEIVIDKHNDDWIATGVRYAHNGETYLAKVCGEVIVSAGSVQSPQLLELSGIGEPAILRRAGIATKVANPNVGENLQEHMMTAEVFELDSSIVGPDQLRADPRLAEAAQKVYDTDQSGIYAMLPCALSYASLPQVVPEHALQGILSKVPSPANTRDKVLLKQFSNAKRGQLEFLFDIGNWSPYFASEPGKVYGTMLMMLQLQLSKGSIHIASSNVNDKPVIDPKYLQGKGGEVDFDIICAGQQFADRICRTQPLASIIQKRAFPPERPHPAHPEDFSAWVRDSMITDWHPIGTCAMGGHAGIKNGVVDSRLRVYGVKGLRVADASIMPLHICAHPQATIYAIGEKAADMILEDRKRFAKL